MSRGGYSGEQIGRYNGSKYKRVLKKETRRQDRRNWTRMGEDAPRKRRYAGWGD